MSRLAALFLDQRRFRSAELARAFASPLRAVSRSPQSESVRPTELSLAPDAAISDGATDQRS